MFSFLSITSSSPHTHADHCIGTPCLNDVPFRSGYKCEKYFLQCASRVPIKVSIPSRSTIPIKQDAYYRSRPESKPLNKRKIFPCIDNGFRIIKGLVSCLFLSLISRVTFLNTIFRTSVSHISCKSTKCVSSPSLPFAYQSLSKLPRYQMLKISVQLGQLTRKLATTVVITVPSKGWQKSSPPHLRTPIGRAPTSKDQLIDHCQRINCFVICKFIININ